jgi:hypothetical protein
VKTAVADVASKAADLGERAFKAAANLVS